jgi:hypothetical protein
LLGSRNATTLGDHSQESDRRNEIPIIVLHVAHSLAYLPGGHHVGREWTEEINRQVGGISRSEPAVAIPGRDTVAVMTAVKPEFAREEQHNPAASFVQRRFQELSLFNFSSNG